MSTKSLRPGVKTLGSCVLLAAAYLLLGLASSQKDFPAGFDAVEAAPKSHRVVFENPLVRVLEVTVPPSGQSEPMHHHRWPSFFVAFDVGGKSNHLRYHRPDGDVRDIPAVEAPRHPGQWRVNWLEPEAMHAIETVEKNQEATVLRVEIKVGR